LSSHYLSIKFDCRQQTFMLWYLLTYIILLLFQAKQYPHKLFVQKQNNHRGIKIKSAKELDFNSSGTFIQEYIDNPLLIDGYKFDIGVYTIITSIDPLRVYIYNGDILFRYALCFSLFLFWLHIYYIYIFYWSNKTNSAAMAISYNLVW